MSFPFYDDPAGHYPPDTYHGDTGEASAWIRPSTTTPEIEYANGGSCEYLLSGPQSAGKLGIYRWSFGEKDSGPDAHFHKSIAELFYVLEGEVRLYDGHRWQGPARATSSTSPRAGCTASGAATTPGCC